MTFAEVGGCVKGADAPVFEKPLKGLLPVNTAPAAPPPPPPLAHADPWRGVSECFLNRALMCRFHQRRGGLQYGAAARSGNMNVD